MKKFLSNIAVVAAMYTVGLSARILFLIFKWSGRITIVNPENFPDLESRMMIVANHSDLFSCMFEIFLIPALVFPIRRILLHPLKSAPWFTPDKRNFTDKWYWAWLRPRAISVQRGKNGKGAGEARKMLDVLGRLKGKIVHFPEGGRTCTGKNHRRSRRGKPMRELGLSVGWLALKTQAPVWPIWLEHGEVKLHPGKKLFSWPRFGRGPITVKFGKLMRMDEGLMAKSPAELTRVIAKNLLELADQE